MPEPTDDLRRAIRDAARSVPIRLGPNALDIAQRGGPIHLNGGETDQLVDAVMAVLDAEFARPLLALDPPPEMSPEDVAAWHAAWAETFTGDTQTHVRILPPNGDAAALRRVRDAVTALDGQLAHEDTGERHVLQQIQSALTEES
ncbi:hypothetical protein [Actinocrinis sp.]|uniref:hypothetical protein n=1 Tax=Actinocrinis sp. TaxID=1920516 RepID=UPI002D4C798E|nr:hypothetical protein [Actinocrinis sp.]HZP49657.1 hypothetical protein [Actinocrinis sp.]